MQSVATSSAAPDGFKVVVKMQRRDDGGLRAWSDDVRQLVLSHSDPALVLRDIQPALQVILSELWGREVRVHALRPVATASGGPDSAAVTVDLESAEPQLEFAALAA